MKLIKKLRINTENESFLGKTSKWLFAKSEDEQNTDIANAFFSKYKLADDSKMSLEKKLRNSAINNSADDVKIFINAAYNINYQDNNIASTKSGLH